jgi:hypothetical protein|tara:strand:+ start:394 stop:624 length:231 start_codon:yes stop_codon:yes gene_type:complete
MLKWKNEELDDLLNYANEKYNEWDTLKEYYQGRIEGGNFTPRDPEALKHAKSQYRLYKAIVNNLLATLSEQEGREA